MAPSKPAVEIRCGATQQCRAPPCSGCREIRELKDTAPEQILHFQLLPFRPPEAEKPDGARCC